MQGGVVMGGVPAEVLMEKEQAISELRETNEVRLQPLYMIQLTGQQASGRTRCHPMLRHRSWRPKCGNWSSWCGSRMQKSLL